MTLQIRKIQPKKLQATIRVHMLWKCCTCLSDTGFWTIVCVEKPDAVMIVNAKNDSTTSLPSSTLPDLVHQHHDIIYVVTNSTHICVHMNVYRQIDYDESRKSAESENTRYLILKRAMIEEIWHVSHMIMTKYYNAKTISMCVTTTVIKVFYDINFIIMI